MIILDNISLLCIPIVAAILGIAFPIIIQTISQIDKKYNSLRLVKRFRKEKLYRYLWSVLIITILALFYNNLFIIPWKYNLGYVLNCVMSNSSNFIVLATSIWLIYILFSVAYLIIKYSDDEDLFERILEKVKQSEVIEEDDVQDLAELVKYVVPKANNQILVDFYKFLDDYSRKKSKNGHLIVFEYDNWFYEVILSLNETICIANVHYSSITNQNDIVKLLIPESSKIIISEKTYFVLWLAIQQQLLYDKVEWMFNYWAFAHQHMWLKLKPIWPKYDYLTGDAPILLNEKEVEKRERQIDRYRDFHLALCGYILYLKEYELIKQITNYTQSEPYQFPLVPSTLIEIVEEFKSATNIDGAQSMYFQKHYPFYGVKGVSSGDISLAWFKRYLSLLLFRLNSSEVNYIASYLDPWQLPVIPRKLNEMAALLSVVEQMLQFVNEWTDEWDVLNKLGWNVEADDIDPLSKLNEFSEQLQEGIIKKRQSIGRSTKKTIQFNNRTKDIIEKDACVYRDVLDGCHTELNKDLLIKDIINTSLSQKMKKETFSDESISTHLNFDEIMAETMVRDFLHLYSTSFYKHKKRHFTINSDEMFNAMDRLIGESRDDYIVIVFGLYLDFYLNGPQKQLALSKVEEESNSIVKYNFKDSLEIYSLPSVGNGLMDQVAVIIKKVDLPCYENYEPTNEIIYNLKLDSKPIDKELNIFTSVLFDNFPQRFENLEDTDYCLATVYYCVLLYWKKDADVTILKTITRYLDSGEGMDISELPKLGE